MTAADQPEIRVLSGCTGVGKTEWALRWAEANDAEIVSCDSLLIYRGMDIGTAKPTPKELARVRHHLVDVVDIGGRYDVVRYSNEALAAVRDVLSRGKRVLVAGGSGFYLRSFFAPIADDLPTVPGLRERLEQRLEEDGVGSLLAELTSLNPGGVGELDVRNPRRVVRALERCIASGKPLLELLAAFKARPGVFEEFDVQLTELVRDPVELPGRLERRISGMLASGLVEEVIRLERAGLRGNPSAARAIGYREVLDHLDGKLPREAIATEILRNTRALARKQRTWFRTQLPGHRTVDAGAIAGVGELFP